MPKRFVFQKKDYKSSLLFFLKLFLSWLLFFLFYDFLGIYFYDLKNSSQLNVFWISISSVATAISVLLNFFLMRNVLKENKIEYEARRLAELRNKMDILLSKFNAIDKTNVKILARYCHYILIDLYSQVEKTKNEVVKIEFTTHSILGDIMEIVSEHFLKQGELYDKIREIAIKQKVDFKSLFLKFRDILKNLESLKFEYISSLRITSIGHNYADRYIHNFLNLFRKRMQNRSTLNESINIDEKTIFYNLNDTKKIISFASTELESNQAIELIFKLFDSIKNLTEEEYGCMIFPYSYVWRDILENKLDTEHSLYIYDIYLQSKKINEYKKEFGL